MLNAGENDLERLTSGAAEEGAEVRNRPTFCVAVEIFFWKKITCPCVPFFLLGWLVIPSGFGARVCWLTEEPSRPRP